MSCHCHSSPCQCSSGGTGWNPPTPGSLVIAPPGSHVVQAPLAYPCSGDQAQSLSGATQAAACQGYPTLNSQVTFPNAKGSGQFRAACASSWAIPGMQLWFPPVGLVKVIGVSGELVTFENLTIPAGTTMDSGSPIVPSGPAPAAVGSTDGVLRVVMLEETTNSGDGATWRSITSMSSSSPVLLPSRPSVVPGSKIWALLEVGLTAGNGSGGSITGAWLFVDEVLQHSVVSNVQSTARTLIIDVTDMTYLDMRVTRQAGTGDITGWMRVLGYYV